LVARFSLIVYIPHDTKTQSRAKILRFLSSVPAMFLPPTFCIDYLICCNLPLFFNLVAPNDFLFTSPFPKTRFPSTATVSSPVATVTEIYSPEISSFPGLLSLSR